MQEQLIYVSYNYINMSGEALDDQKIQKILLQLNKIGLSYLKFLQFREAIDYFKKAENILNEQFIISKDDQKINQLAAVTYNNLACYYKKNKKPKVALKYLKKSLQLEIYKINDWVSAGSTHLNICAIYSYLGKHQQALSHSKLAIQLLQKKNMPETDASLQSKSFWNIKMLCYYNKAIQQEYLKRYQLSLQSYKAAKQTAKLYGAKNVAIILNCDEAISRIETILLTLKKRIIGMLLKRREDQQSGHYEFMRNNIRHSAKRQLSPLGLHEQKLKKLQIYRHSQSTKRDRSHNRQTLHKIIKTNINKNQRSNEHRIKRNKTEPMQIGYLQP